ncbi:hypothetical protein cce_0421 [Crocosphaera subtropica ATCC 51142]|uniref:Uncharacterized protein n=1 Tax=Crocosphaera subtropica (strain ATCC 51142 / BH68) TaxID=43989 RepID=B1WND0_CROS5|nr:hypothetical protein [Crocosphaera subtropica]ACB49772.1 hypothetical protein cce_0421 [Crocosphaera subtropica ATCC 51142]
MKISWKKLLIQTSVWITSEIVLNLIGLDNIADYSEFIFKQKETIFLTTAISERSALRCAYVIVG